MGQFVVIGLGRFGSHVARSLYAGGHEVLAIDSDPQAVQRVRDEVTRAVVLDARDKERLAALGAHEADAVVLSLGEQIEASALAALHLKELGVRYLIAKAGSEDHAKLLKLIGVDEVIFPERQAAERLANRLRDANVLDYIPLGQGYSIHEITPPAEFLGKSLAELRLRNRFGVQVLALRDTRSGELLVNPGAEAVIHDRHVMIVLGADRDLDRLRSLHRK